MTYLVNQPLAEPRAGEPQVETSLRPRRPPRRPSTRLLLGAEVHRMRTIALRYPWEAIAGVLGLAFMFLVFAAIGTVTTGPFAMFSGNLKSLAVLYALWTMSMSSISLCAAQIGADAAAGVLENLFLSAAPVVAILQARTAAQLMMSAFNSAVLLFAFCLGTAWLPSPIVAAAAVVAFIGCGVTTLGLAMIFAGAALMSKRVSTMTMPANFLCILAIATSHPPGFDRLDNPLLYLPFVAGAQLVRQAVEQGRFDPLACGVALAGAIPYVLLGRFVLGRCAMACRRAGTTSVY